MGALMVIKKRKAFKREYWFLICAVLILLACD